MAAYNVPAGAFNKKTSESNESVTSKKRKLEEISNTEKKKPETDN